MERQQSIDSSIEINRNGGQQQNYSSTQPTQSPEPNVEVKSNNDKPRAIWAGHIEFLLSCISFAVGLGNIWRFPHQCYQNGGGAFLIPYLLMLVLLGLPLFFLEMAFGQYASLGPITIWRVCPLFKGLGYMMVFISSVVSIYYNVIIGYTLLFLFYSFTSKLPWSYCHSDWINCTLHVTDCLKNTSNIINSTINYNQSTQSPVDLTTMLSNITSPEVNCKNEYSKTPAEIFWYDNVLDKSDGIHEMGGLRWKLVLFLLLAWVIVFLCIMKGIKSSGKVAYFTGTFPFAVLIILFFRGVTLEGAGKGIKFYLNPNFEMMKHAKVWRAAAVQILYSLGPGFGGLLTMSSYNKFNNNCHRDALIVALVNSGTSVFAGFVIFSVLGFMAHETQQEVKDVVKSSGPGLAFIAYPAALAQMKGGPFWSVCFFFMLFILGLGSQFAGIEAIVSAFVDEFSILRRKSILFTAIICTLLFFLGFPCVTQGGMYMLELIDTYATSFPLLIVVLLEVIVLMYIYGRKRILKDISSMIGFEPNIYWQICWTIIAPLIIVFIVIASCIEYDGMKYEGYEYPGWAEALGWLIVAAIILCLPVYMIIKVANCVGSFKNLWWVIRGPYAIKALNLRTLIEPSSKWGPALEENRLNPEERLELPPEIDHTETARIFFENRGNEEVKNEKISITLNTQTTNNGISTDSYI